MNRMIRTTLYTLFLFTAAGCSGSESPTPQPGPQPPATQLAAPVPTEVAGVTTENSFTVQWQAVVDAVSYTLQIDGGEEQSTPYTILTVPNCDPATAYTVRVKAVSGDTSKHTDSEWGSVVVTTQGSLPVERKDYKLVWSDEFDGTELDTSVWNYQQGGNGYGNQEKQYYTSRPENVRIEDGCLVIEARKERYESNDYTSARINSKGKKEFTYGRIEARIQLPSGAGTWPAFWMLGANHDVYKWPGCGELDIMEHVGKEPTMISHALHTSERNGGSSNNWNARTYIDGIEEGFHIFSVEWEQDWDSGDDLMQFLVDGQVTGRCYQPSGSDDNYKAWPFNKPFFLIFNVALGGTWGGPIDDTIFAEPVLMKVDYIRVYQRVD